MECEQKGLFDHEIAFLKGLEETAVNHGIERVLRASTKRVAAMRLATAREMAFMMRMAMLHLRASGALAG